MSHIQGGAQTRLMGSEWIPAVARGRRMILTRGWDTGASGSNTSAVAKGLRLRGEAPAHSKSWLNELCFSGFSGRK